MVIKLKERLLYLSPLLIVIGIYLIYINYTQSIINVLKYKDLNLAYSELTVSEKDIEKRFEEEVKDLTDVITIKKGVVKDNDIANIDYEGTLKGIPFEGGADDEYDLEIGSNSFIPGFEEGLIGKDIGKTHDIELTFPKDYHSEDLKGKKVVFSVLINYVERKELPKNINDSLIKNITDGEFDSVSKYKEHITNLLKNELEEENYSNKEKLVWEYINDNSEVKKISKKEMFYYKNMFVNHYKSFAKNYEVDLTTFIKDYLKSNLKEFNKEKSKYALETVKKYEIAKIISKTEKIEITEKDYDNHLKNSGLKKSDVKNDAKFIKDELLYQKTTNYLINNNFKNK